MDPDIHQAARITNQAVKFQYDSSDGDDGDAGATDADAEDDDDCDGDVNGGLLKMRMTATMARSCR